MFKSYSIKNKTKQKKKKKQLYMGFVVFLYNPFRKKYIFKGNNSSMEIITAHHMWGFT